MWLCVSDPKTRKVIYRRYKSSMANDILLAFHRSLSIELTLRQTREEKQTPAASSEDLLWAAVPSATPVAITTDLSDIAESSGQPMPLHKLVESQLLAVNWPSTWRYCVTSCFSWQRRYAMQSCVYSPTWQRGWTIDNLSYCWHDDTVNQLKPVQSLLSQ